MQYFVPGLDDESMVTKRENRPGLSYGAGRQPMQRRQEARSRQAMPGRKPYAAAPMDDMERLGRRGSANRQRTIAQSAQRRQSMPSRQERFQTRNPYPAGSRNPQYMEDDYEEFDSFEARQQELERIRRNRARAKHRQQQRRRMLILSGLAGCFMLALLCLLIQYTRHPQSQNKDTKVFLKEPDIAKPTKVYQEELVQGMPSSTFYTHPFWTEDFLSVSEWARPGEALPEVKNIFVHYTANKNTSAAQNRSYFEGLKDSHVTAASAHFIIGYEGEIIQCIPLDEIGYAVKSRNYDSISIECCYQSKDGSFNKKTYDSLITLLKWLTEAYALKAEDILRHYDCGGKKCPIYYTEHPDAWEQLKKDVAER